MDALVNQLVQLVQGVPAESFFVVYLIAAVWLAIESLGIGVPEESILLLLGATVSQRVTAAAQGLSLAIGAALLGTIAGALGGYAIGRRAESAIVRVGRFVGLRQPRADHLELWLRHRGAFGVFVARLVPVMRGLSPYVIGASHERLRVFLLGTTAGALVFTVPWVVVGFALGTNYHEALGFLDRYGLLALAVVVGILAVVVLLHYLWIRFIWRRLAAHYHHHHRHAPAAVAK